MFNFRQDKPILYHKFDMHVSKYNLSMQICTPNFTKAFSFWGTLPQTPYRVRGSYPGPRWDTVPTPH